MCILYLLPRSSVTQDVSTKVLLLSSYWFTCFFKVTTVTDSLNNLTVQSGDDEVPGLTQHRVTKAQRRREKKTTQLKERELRIAEQEVQNLQGIRHVESLKINEILKKRDLMVFEIPSDGNW